MARRPRQRSATVRPKPIAGGATVPQYVTVHIGPGYAPDVVLSPGDDVAAAVDTAVGLL